MAHIRTVVPEYGAMKNLNAKALLALVVLAVGLGLLVFIPAWTVHY